MSTRRGLRSMCTREMDEPSFNRMMRRRLLNLLVALSSLLCVTVALLWVRSYWTVDGVQWLRSKDASAYLLAVKSRGGCLTVGRYAASTAGPVRQPVAWHTEIASVPTGLTRGRWYWNMPMPGAGSRGGYFRGGAGFYWHSTQGSHVPHRGPLVHTRQHFITVPHWLALAAFAVPPAAAFARARRQRRTTARN